MTNDGPDEMRRAADWMQPSDDRILELLREHELLTPKQVQILGGPASGTAHNRLPILRKYGLVERVDRGIYRLADRGRSYLDEELDASELDPIEDIEE